MPKETMPKTVKTTRTPKAKANQYFEGVGRRKTAVARVRLYLTSKDKTATLKSSKIKQGEIVFNEKPVDQIIMLASDKARLLRPLHVTESMDRFAISIQATGGGLKGQIDASILGIARALEMIDRETFRPILKAGHLLSRDARIRERRKVGTGGKARRQKQSPKR